MEIPWVLAVVIVLILVISVYINVNFYEHYVRDLGYPNVYYKDLVYRTGDLILFRSYSSAHMWLSSDKFSHIAIVIVINGVPYCIELHSPEVKLTPLFVRFDKFKSGAICIKQIKTPVHMDENKLNSILHFAQDIKYPESFVETAKVFVRFCTEGVWNIANKKDFVCGKFVLHVMHKLGILNGNETGICNIGTWLSNLREINGYEYAEINQLTFFDEDGLTTKKKF